jgi:hypothetical protein
MVSHQLFTQIAVTTVINHINIVWPSIGALLFFTTDMLVFIYAFAWVFLLSSAIPSVILGKERSVLVQFLVCLALAFVAFSVQNVLTIFGSRSIDQLFGLAASFNNPFLAITYLLLPYFLMFILDIHSRKKRKGKEPLKKLTGAYSDDAATGNKNAQENYSHTST